MQSKEFPYSRAGEDSPEHGFGDILLVSLKMCCKTPAILWFLSDTIASYW